MKVQATKVGYYDHMRRYPAGHGHARAGEVFELKAMKRPRVDKLGDPIVDDEGKQVFETITIKQQFSKKWMKRVDGDVEQKVEKDPTVGFEGAPEKPKAAKKGKPSGDQKVL